MICYGVTKLRDSGIRDILIVTSRAALGDFANILGSGRDWGVSIMYRVQEEAGGIAQALEMARPFLSPKDKFVVLLGDNLFEDNLRPYCEQFAQQNDGAMVLLKEVADPRRYGVPKLEEKNGRILHIEEKPVNPPSSFCVTGIYFYNSEVFDLIQGIKPSRRGELEITDVNNEYASSGRLLYHELTGWWTDAGTFESLEEAGRRLKGAIT